ncbi:hypothetical protein IV02_13225 [Pseudomonas syringae]|uniref:Pycsar effector protein domain-containing protein n=1 Tax=Pseudomonas syringae TaxID=317 RepID=A0A085V6V7_PSESX|nr:hypothetical protein IV02_13225 [Pseudomonas syringae]
MFRIVNRYDHYIELANNKANFLLAFLVSINLAVAALLGYIDIFKFELVSPCVNIFKVLVLLVYLFFIGAGCRVLFFLYRVILPNTSSPSSTTPSSIFFGDVASLTPDNYAGVIDKLSEGEFVRDLSFQANVMAGIVSDKFASQKILMRVTLLWLVPSAFLVAVGCVFLKAVS